MSCSADVKEKIETLDTQLKGLQAKLKSLSRGLDKITKQLRGEEPEEDLPVVYKSFFDNVSTKNTGFLERLSQKDAQFAPHCQAFRQAIIEIKDIPATKLGATQLVEKIEAACEVLGQALNEKYIIDGLGIATILDYVPFENWIKTKSAIDLDGKIIPLAAALRDFIRDGLKTDDQFVNDIAKYLERQDKQTALTYLLFANQFLGYNFLNWAALQAFYFAHKPTQQKSFSNVMAYLLRIIAYENSDYVKAIEGACTPSNYSKKYIKELPNKIQLTGEIEPDVSWVGADYTDAGRITRAEIVCAIHARYLLDNVKDFEKELLREQIRQEQENRKKEMKPEDEMNDVDKKNQEEDEKIAHVIDEIRLEIPTKKTAAKGKKELGSLLEKIKKIAGIQTGDILDQAGRDFNFIAYLEDLLMHLSPENLRKDEQLQELLGYTDTILTNILKSPATLENMVVRLTENSELYAVAQLIRLLLCIPNELLKLVPEQQRLTADSIKPVAAPLYYADKLQKDQSNILTHYFKVIAKIPGAREEAEDFVKSYESKISMGPKNTLFLKLKSEIAK